MFLIHISNILIYVICCVCGKHCNGGQFVQKEKKKKIIPAILIAPLTSDILYYRDGNLRAFTGNLAF